MLPKIVILTRAETNIRNRNERTNIRIFVRFDDVSIIKPNQRIFDENDEKIKKGFEIKV